VGRYVSSSSEAETVGDGVRGTRGASGSSSVGTTSVGTYVLSSTASVGSWPRRSETSGKGSNSAAEPEPSLDADAMAVSPAGKTTSSDPPPEELARERAALVNPKPASENPAS